MRTLLAAAPLAIGVVDLDAQEARHGQLVLRIRLGERVRLADGAGRRGTGTVTLAQRDRMQVTLDQLEELPPGPAALLSVACAVPKGERFDDLVRGLTELGVGRIQPLACQRGVRMPEQFERARRIAAEALKQCGRGWLPQIGPLVDIPALAASGQVLIIFDRSGAIPQCGTPVATTLVIGPEGGWAPEEIATLVAAGARTVRLGHHVLRIETAALAAAAVWAAAWEVA